MIFGLKDEAYIMDYRLEMVLAGKFWWQFFRAIKMINLDLGPRSLQINRHQTQFLLENPSQKYCPEALKILLTIFNYD
jgi:hypothetical protein